jgi:hypothetical protein
MKECKGCGKITRKGVRMEGQTLCPTCAYIIDVLVGIYEADRLQAAEEEEA